MKPGQIVTEFEKTIPRSSEKMKELSVSYTVPIKLKK